VRRLLTPGVLVPLLLAIVGAALIIVGQLNLDQGVAGGSLPPIPEPTPSATPRETPAASATGSPEVPTPSPSPSPTPTPDPKWVAVQLQIRAIGLNVAVRRATTSAQCDFPPELRGVAWVLCGGSEPGRGTNSYIFAHAQVGMFLPLWNVQLGDDVLILMSDGQVLRYVVTEIHPNVSCPDSRADPMPLSREPLALRYAAPGCGQGAYWQQATDHERLTLQTSQGPNRNWGEFIVVAKPAP